MKAVSFLLAMMIFLGTLTGCQKTNAQYTHKPDFELASKAAFLVDVNTNDIIYEKNADTLIYPAALTQMLTALVTMKQTQDLNTEVTVPDDFTVSQGSESSPISDVTGGETFTVNDLLHCIIMNNDNNAATLIAQAVGGDMNTFISKLNEEAKALGTKSTNFINPTGIHDTHNYTTARDMAAIAATAASNTAYMEIASKANYSFVSNENKASHNITSNLTMRTATSEYPEGVKEIKYSNDEDTGSSLVCVLEQDGLKIVAVLMGAAYSSDGAKVYTDMKKLLNWASSTCVLAVAPESGDTILTVGVSGNFNVKELPLKPEKKLSDLLPKKAQLKDIQLFCCIPAEINKPVKSGDVIGKADIIYNGQKTSTVNLIAVGSVKQAGESGSVADILLVVGIVFLSLFLLLLFIRQINIIRYHRKRKQALEKRHQQMRRELEQSGQRPPARRK